MDTGGYGPFFSTGSTSQQTFAVKACSVYFAFQVPAGGKHYKAFRSINFHVYYIHKKMFSTAALLT